MLNGEVKNSNNALVFSKYGYIIIDSQNVSLNGLIYAPFGTVEITANNLNLNNVVIIANKIIMNCPSVNANANNELLEFIGDTTEPIYVPVEEYQYLDDTDEDKLPDIIEKQIGTNPLNPDTDADGLPDGYEKYTTLTDPLIVDTDHNDIDDGNEDFDNDGLNNIYEYISETNPWILDSDEDTLLDGEEVMNYNSSPCLKDTDNDGLDDDDEVTLGTDINNPDSNGNGILDGDEKFNQSFSFINNNEESIITKVSIASECTGNINKTTVVEDISESDSICAGVEGLLGEPFSIETTSNFESATLTFEIDKALLKDVDFEDIMFLWYNESDYKFEELETTYDFDNSSVSIETTHFSKYMIVDKESWLKAWNKELNYTSSNYEQSKCYSVLAIDCSGSMYNNDYIDNNNCKRAEAVKNFINTMDSDDKAAIITFDDNTTVEVELTDNKDKLLEATKSFYHSGGTNFNNAIETATELLQNSSGSTRKNIILLSDGGSSLSEDIKKAAADAHIKIHTIGLGNSDDYTLNEISSYTNGKFTKAYTADELLKIYTMIGISNDFDQTDNDKDGLFDVIETVGIRIQNGSIIYGCDPTKLDTDGDGKNDGIEIDPQIRWRIDKQYYFIMNSNPVVDERYYDVRNHKFNRTDGEYLLCEDCDFKVKSPIYQDKEILSEDDYLKVQALYSEFSRDFASKKERSLEDAIEFYNNSLFIIEIEQIRSSKKYSSKYDYSDETHHYYSDVLNSVNLDKIYYDRNENGEITNTRFCTCSVKTVDQQIIHNYEMQDILLPEIGIAIVAGYGLGFPGNEVLPKIDGHPYIAALLSFIPSVYDGEITEREIISNLFWSGLGVLPKRYGFDVAWVATSLGYTFHSDWSPTGSGANTRPHLGDKYILINRGRKCSCNSRNCKDPGYMQVSKYWYRNGECYNYSFAG